MPSATEVFVKINVDTSQFRAAMDEATATCRRLARATARAADTFREMVKAMRVDPPPLPSPWKANVHRYGR